jgi:hypothetical protein
MPGDFDKCIRPAVRAGQYSDHNRAPEGGTYSSDEWATRRDFLRYTAACFPISSERRLGDSNGWR